MIFDNVEKYTKLLEKISVPDEYSDLYLEREEFFTLTIENDKVKVFKNGIDEGLNLRRFNQGRTHYVSSNVLEYPSLENLIKSMTENNSSSLIVHLPSFTVSGEFDIDKPQMMNMLIDQSKFLRSKSSQIQQITLRALFSKKDIMILSNQGLCVQDSRKYSRFFVQLVVAEDNEVQTAYQGPGISGSFDIFQQYSLPITCDIVLDRAVRMLKAEPAPTGRMPVVMLGEAGGTMVHEACGHSLEADFIYKGTSNLFDKVGQKVASEKISVIDDPTIPALYGSYKYDDEGVRSRKNVLIEQGILKGFMSDRVSAEMLGGISSGNGRRESFRSKPVPRMSNTYIENGKDDPQEILASVEKGILVSKMGGGQVNITNGDFIFEVAEGYLIEKGIKKQLIRGASLIGNGLQVLQDIEMVGNDNCFLPGVCGKYDSVPVSDAQPTIKIKELTVGGC